MDIQEVHQKKRNQRERMEKTLKKETAKAKHMQD